MLDEDFFSAVTSSLQGRQVMPGCTHKKYLCSHWLNIGWMTAWTLPQILCKAMLISTGSKPLGRKLDDSQGIILEVVLMAFKESYKPTELAYTLCQVPTSFCFHGKPKQWLRPPWLAQTCPLCPVTKWGQKEGMPLSPLFFAQGVVPHWMHLKMSMQFLLHTYGYIHIYDCIIHIHMYITHANSFF